MVNLSQLQRYECYELPVRKLLAKLLLTRAAFALAFASAGACVENGVVPTGDGPKAPEDSGDSGVPLTETCPDGPEDGTTVLTGTCTLPTLDWALTEKWSWDSEDHRHRHAHVGRFEDSDGDGAVTVRDAVTILLMEPTRGVSGNPPVLLSGAGEVLYEDDTFDEWSMYATVGDADPTRVGMEYLLVGLSADLSVLAVAASAPGTVLYLEPVAVDRHDVGLGAPFLADLDADGAPEVIGRGMATSAVDGRTLFTFPASDSSGVRAVAADLDLDGFPEILAGLDHEPAIRDGAGQLIAVCAIGELGPDEDDNTIFAVGNLDDDANGEFVVVREGVLAVCEADGSIRAATMTGSANATVVGIAELTGDDAPEILVDEYHPAEAVRVSVAAYDRDLRLLWRHPLSVDDGKAPFSVADLDGDGRHEVLVHPSVGGLLVLSPAGEVLTTIDGPGTGTIDPPIVADIDGDGLAEIVASGEWPNLTVYTNAAGGWAGPGAQHPWPGVDRFPGDRNLDGTLPDPADVHWLRPGENVWQGLASGRAALPDLTVDLAYACSDDCQATVLVAYVSNRGGADALMPITLELSNLDDGAVLARAELDGLPSGVSRAIELEVPTASVGAGVRMNVSSRWAECLDASNEVVITDLPCR